MEKTQMFNIMDIWKLVIHLTLTLMIPISLLFVISCGKTLSDDYSEVWVECGEEIKAPHVIVNSKDGVRLEGADFKVFVSKINGEIEEVQPTSKGCVALNTLGKSSSILVRSTSGEAGTWELADIITEESIRLESIPESKPVADCGLEYPNPEAIIPEHFLKTDNIKWKKFYQVEGKMIPQEGQQEPGIDLEKIFLDGTWDLSKLQKASGKYELKLSVTDYISGGSPIASHCIVDTSEYMPEARLFAPVGDIREYFSESWLTVDPQTPIILRSDSEQDGPESYSIQQCITAINTEDPEAIKLTTERLQSECNRNFLWVDEEKIYRLDPGFYALLYKMKRDSLDSGWKIMRILVKKSCSRESHPTIKEIAEDKCTDYTDDLVIPQSVEGNLVLTYLSEIRKNLVIKQTNLTEFSTPHLLRVGDLYIEENNKLETVNFEVLSDINNLHIKGNRHDTAFAQFKNLKLLSWLISEPITANFKLLTALSKLENLTINLDENFNELSSLSEFSKLSNLVDLTLRENQISDISWLKEMKKLQFLYLSGNQISDISLLRNLKNLTLLDLTDNQISDASGLKELKELGFLSLDNNQISDISWLKDIKELATLSLGDNLISDISWLKDMNALSSLNLSGNQISDISWLKDMRKLINLELSGGQISDISWLKNMKELDYLDLSNNQITDISALKDMKNLTVLSLNSNQISDISPLKEMKSLTTLWLNSNRISDISPLKKMNELTSVSLSKNQISDISWLRNAKNVRNLYLSGNQISDISWLKNLKKLSQVTFQENPLGTTTPKDPVNCPIGPKVSREINKWCSSPE